MRFSGMMLLLVTEQNKFAMLGFCIDGTKPTGSEEQNIMYVTHLCHRTGSSNLYL